MCLKRKNFERF